MKADVARPKFVVTTPKQTFTVRRPPMIIEILTSAILRQMPNISKRNRNFFLHLMILLVSLRGRFNFMNLGRYGLFNEVTYRQRFSKAFDFMAFNSKLITAHCSKERMIAFDPSYLPKSGKHTFGLEPLGYKPLGF